jgi:hypothetical protein
MVLTRSFVGYMLDTKDIPCKYGKVCLNAHTLRQKTRSKRDHVKSRGAKIAKTLHQHIKATSTAKSSKEYIYCLI